MILSASIVGSGELIMTTALGAQAGFVALWVIIVSCLVKVCVQLEFGKHAISSGQSTMAALDGLRGPRFAGVSWTIWMWLLVQLVIFVQYGGLATGVGQAMNIAVPAVPVWLWACITGLATAVLISSGRYRTIQNVSIALLGLFTLFTLICVGMLQGTDYAICAGPDRRWLYVPASQGGPWCGSSCLWFNGSWRIRNHCLSLLVPGKGIRGIHGPA